MAKRAKPDVRTCANCARVAECSHRKNDGKACKLHETEEDQRRRIDDLLDSESESNRRRESRRVYPHNFRGCDDEANLAFDELDRFDM